MKKRWIEKAVLLLSLAGALFLFAFFLKDILIPLFTLQLKNDVEGAKALVTGESLGQVASQTLDNIAAVNEVVSMPVLRPLIGSDKQEIIARAHEIGTFDICCESAEDCCTLFMPRSPETHAKPDQIHEAWDMFDHDAMIEDLVKSAEWVDFDQCPAYKPPRTLRESHTELAPRFSE